MRALKVFVIFIILKVCHGYNRVCYYTNWAQYRPSNGKFFPENLDPFLCTHLIYAFAKMDGNRLVAFEWNDESTDWMRGMYARFNDIKLKNPSLKTLLAVGGWNMGSRPFTQMVNTTATRAEFVKSTIQFLRERNFDGLDLDWEYPANRGSPKEDKDKYTKLVIQLRNAFNQEAAITGKIPLLLTAAVAAGKDKVDTGYDIQTIARHMDFINVMTYDLHGPWEKKTGHNSPLSARRDENEAESRLNIKWAAEYWWRNGLPKEKLNVGLALYGRSFTLVDPYNNGVGAPAKDKGHAGNYTREAGFLSYFEICQRIAEGAQRHYILEQDSPYITFGDQWVGYDDPESLSKKVDYVKNSEFGGIMVWALDLDDFNMICNSTTHPYPLLTRIVQQLGVKVPSKQNVLWPPKKTRPSTSRKTQPLPKAPKKSTRADKEFVCEVGGDGYYPSPYSCREYYMCSDGHAYHFKCAKSLLFNSQFNHCGWPKDVTCDLKKAKQKAKKSLVAPTTPVPTKPVPTQPAPPPPVVYNPAPVETNQFQFVEQRPTEPQFQTTAPQVHVQPQPQPQQQQAINAMEAINPWNWSPFTNQQHIQNSIPFYWSQIDSQSFCSGRVDGLYPDPDNCRGFIDCVSEISFKGLCNAGMAFDTTRHTCDNIHNIPGCP